MKGDPDAELQQRRQDIPGETGCPACGAPPTEESRRNVQLSNLGYKHEDMSFECSAEDCSKRWVCGVPIGASFAFGDRLWCDACDDAWMLVHRVIVRNQEVQQDRVGLHYKCPNHSPLECPDCGLYGEPRFEPDGIYCRGADCEHEYERDDLEGCYNFEQDHRPLDDQGRTLIGYPQITGEIVGAKPYGWEQTDDPDDVVCGEPACIEHGEGTLGCPLDD